MRNTFFRIFYLGIFCFLGIIPCSAQNMCITLPAPQYQGTVQRNGAYIASHGTIKSLMIFIQFQGDTTYPDSSQWPCDQPPVFLRTFLDSLENQNSAPYSLSDYYKQMSFGQLKIIGKSYFIVTQHNENYYRNTLEA